MSTTPLAVIAQISRVVTKVVDRVVGDRSDVPLMVSAATVQALQQHQIAARVMYGPAAWVEVMEDHSVLWAGCWGKSFHFWAATDLGEVIDLNVSVANRKRSHDRPEVKALLAPPMLWSIEVPAFYRYVPEGVAELELHDARDIQQFERVLNEIREKCRPELLPPGEPGADAFPNEPILCNGRRILDDSAGSFRQFDRTLSVRGIPKLPDGVLRLET
ncbi:MAG: hypothetical protein ACK5QT_02120 [Oligoflexia bacterium]|jgi:hypothetical protein